MRFEVAFLTGKYPANGGSLLDLLFNTCSAPFVFRLCPFTYDDEWKAADGRFSIAC
jgi:hypothetical protein